MVKDGLQWEQEMEGKGVKECRRGMGAAGASVCTGATLPSEVVGAAHPMIIGGRGSATGHLLISHRPLTSNRMLFRATRRACWVLLSTPTWVPRWGGAVQAGGLSKLGRRAGRQGGKWAGRPTIQPLDSLTGRKAGNVSS